MASPVDLAFAKEALRAPDEDELVLERYLEAATGSVYRYLGWTATEYDAADELDQESVKNAILMLAGHFYRSPDVDPDGAFGHGRLPWMVTAPLYQLRDPPLA